MPEGGHGQFEYYRRELPAFFRRHPANRTLSLDEHYKSSVGRFSPANFQNLCAFQLRSISTTETSYREFRRLVLNKKASIRHLRVVANKLDILTAWIVDAKKLKDLRCLELQFDRSTAFPLFLGTVVEIAYWQRVTDENVIHYHLENVHLDFPNILELGLVMHQKMDAQKFIVRTPNLSL